MTNALNKNYNDHKFSDNSETNCYTNL